MTSHNESTNDAKGDNDHAAAKASLSKALAINPKLPAAHWRLGMLAKENGDYSGDTLNKLGSL